ncbi:MAG: DUF6272 family protein [Bacteroidia bacterium]
MKSKTDTIVKSPLLQKRIRYIFDELVSNVYEYYKQQGFSGEITSVDGYFKPNNWLEFSLISTLGKADKASLKKHIDFINSLDEAGLKDFYKKKLNEPTSAKASAGIGLISIRMKSRNPIEYEFKKSKSDDVVFFKIIINLKNE